MSYARATARVGRLGPVIVLVAVAAGCWAVSAVRMNGMDAGPGGELGATGWFTGTWAVMMTAMMVPVVTPLAVRGGRRLGGAVTFVAAYLALWAAAGLLVYGLVVAARHALGAELAWTQGGRWAAVAVLALAGAYQLTGGKRRSLERCRRTTGSTGASAGLEAGANCLSSSWAMMAALFALGVMSLQWMVLVAGLIAAERLPRNPLPGRLAAAAVFLALALGVAIVPGSVPGLTIPGSPGAMKAMARMSPAPAMGASMK
jgi:predicted metal-binding membrane protein